MPERFTNRDVLITGATGFIGGNMSEELQRQNVSFEGTTRNTESELARQLKLTKLDVTDKDEFARKLSLVKPKFIFHFAGWSIPKDSQKAPEEAYKIIVDSTLNIAYAILEVRKRDNTFNPKVIVSGSVSAFGPGRKDSANNWISLNENSVWSPNSEYGRLKVLKTDTFLDVCEKNDIDGLVAIQANASGVSSRYKIVQKPGFFIPDTMMKVVSIVDFHRDNPNDELPPLVTGSVNQSVNLMRVQDLIDAYIKLGYSSARGKVVVGAEKSVPLIDIVKDIISVSGLDIKHVQPVQNDPANIVPDQNYDVTKLKSIIKKAPGGLSHDDLRNTLNRYQELYGKKR